MPLARSPQIEHRCFEPLNGWFGGYARRFCAAVVGEIFVFAEMFIWLEKLPGLPGPGPGEKPPMLLPLRSDVSGFNSGGEIGPIWPIIDGSNTVNGNSKRTKKKQVDISWMVSIPFVYKFFLYIWFNKIVGIEIK